MLCDAALIIISLTSLLKSKKNMINENSEHYYINFSLVRAYLIWLKVYLCVHAHRLRTVHGVTKKITIISQKIWTSKRIVNSSFAIISIRNKYKLVGTRFWAYRCSHVDMSMVNNLVHKLFVLYHMQMFKVHKHFIRLVDQKL